VPTRAAPHNGSGDPIARTQREKNSCISRRDAYCPTPVSHAALLMDWEIDGMMGPVFALEWMRTGRRLRAHLFRWICGALLLLQFLYYYSHYLDAGVGKPGVLANFAGTFLDLILLEEFLVVVLVTPALVAGTITEEKSRRTLEQLLTSQIPPLAIVVGKLLARMTDVVVLTLVVLPLAAFVGPYAGASPAFLLGQAVVTIFAAFGLSCLSLLASVWTRQTRAAVFAVYAVGLLAAGLYWSGWLRLPGWVQWFDPIRVLTPARDGSDVVEFLRRLGRFAAAWLIFGCGCTLLAAWRLRPAYIRQLTARKTRIGAVRRAARPAPAWNPLVWKEKFVGWRVPRWAILLIVAAVTIWTALRELAVPAPVGAGVKITPVQVIINHGWYAIGLLTLLVGVHASGAISGERERGTWDGLLTTPMTFREILRGKLRGIIACAWPFLVTYLLASAAAVAVVTQDSPTFALAFLAASAGLAVGVAVLAPRFARLVFIVLALAWGLLADLPVLLALVMTLAVAWLTMEFFASVGLWCSVRCPSSWRSLLATVGLGFVGGIVLTCVSTPIALSTTVILYLATSLLEHVFTYLSEAAIQFAGPDEIPFLLMPLFSAVGVALTYWWVARSLVFAAESYLAATERIPTGRVRLFDVEQPKIKRAEAPALNAERALDLAQ
jgi:ABC-type transport system involved in multi-copper enzyme maturation permease subunit